jgi:beta-phosphoglucomutase-like phosphatase (HAD superfamily)
MNSISIYSSLCFHWHHISNRKPEPEFYLLACRRNGIQPHEAIFLDDLGQWVSPGTFAGLCWLGSRNLKAAKALGMETIREFNFHYHAALVLRYIDVPIDGSREAIGQLQTKVGIHLFCTSSTPAVTAKL